MEQTRTAFQSHINDTAVEQPVAATVTEYFIQILNIVCIVLSVARNDYIEVLLNHLSVMMECAQTQRLSIVQEMVLPNITKPFKSDLSFLIKKEESKYHPRIGVQRDFVFRSLNEEEKNAFNKLYDQYYYHRHNEFWYQQAMKKLPQLTQSTRMLVCGEDLGMIPACVSSVMNDLRILSLEIQRMPKNPMYEFGHLNEYQAAFLYGKRRNGLGRACL